MHDDATLAREHLWDLIKDIRFAMFATRERGGELRSHPMTTQNSELDEDDRLWFFMSRGSQTVADLHDDPSVNVVYADPAKDRYVSVSGRASIVADAAKRQQLWSKAAQAWFPGGIDDPDLALVQVTISQASYWDVKSSKLVQLYAMAKAALTGKPPTGLARTGDLHLR